MSESGQREQDGIAPDDPGLEDTVAEFEVEEEAAPPPPAASYARFDEQVDIGNVDPELGHMEARRKLNSVQAAVKTKFGQMIFAGVFGLVALAVGLLALTWQTREMAIAAAVLCPPAFIILYNRYRRWVEQRRFMFKLLHSLGEDTTGIDPRSWKQRRKMQRLPGSEPES